MEVVMSKQRKIFRTTSQTEVLKKVRKPAIPRGQVINPRKKYDRKDKGWKSDIY